MPSPSTSTTTLLAISSEGRHQKKKVAQAEHDRQTVGEHREKKTKADLKKVTEIAEIKKCVPVFDITQFTDPGMLKEILKTEIPPLSKIKKQQKAERRVDAGEVPLMVFQSSEPVEEDRVIVEPDNHEDDAAVKDGDNWEAPTEAGDDLSVGDDEEDEDPAQTEIEDADGKGTADEADVDSQGDDLSADDIFEDLDMPLQLHAASWSEVPSAKRKRVEEDDKTITNLHDTPAQWDSPDEDFALPSARTFIHYILSPFVAAKLIEDDFEVDFSSALDIMRDSSDFGDFFHTETSISPVTSPVSTPVKKLTKQTESGAAVPSKLRSKPVISNILSKQAASKANLSASIGKYTLASGLFYDNLEYRQCEIRKLGSLRSAERDPNSNGILSLGNND
ncbi:hypothetical protein B0H14DRAFT_3460895 [Mycena olivaceomarginata]|nr:hypothetical protein B0H14DRAFT_3460895 [Mycena olivaceomarginata]